MRSFAGVVIMKFAKAEAGEKTGKQKQRPVPCETKEESFLHSYHFPVDGTQGRYFKRSPANRLSVSPSCRKFRTSV
jgi:hypothetical protein